MNEYDHLKERIEQEELKPNPKVIGQFVKQNGESKDKLRFLYPNNWVFHDQIVDRVLEGDYFGIKPVCAEFDVTMNCSNRCDMCGYKLVKKLEGCWDRNIFTDKEMHLQSVDKGRLILDKMIAYGVKGIIFSGGGEPFLFKGLEELVHHASRNGVDTVVYSNGNAIVEERMEKLIESKPLLVRVSLNAGTEEVYDQFHNPIFRGALKNVLKSLKLLAKGAKENPRMSVGVGMVINEINRYDLVEAAKRVKEVVEETEGGIEFIAYRPVFDYYSKEQLPAGLLDETSNIVETEVRKVLEGTGVRVINVKGRYEALKRNTRTYSKCRAAGLFAEVVPGGNCFLCCDRNFNRRYLIGNLEKSDMADVVSGDHRMEVLEYINSNRCVVCPPACKSHEINNQFQQIEDLRIIGQMYKVKLWIDEQRKMPKPKMVNFP